jgi:hypothetical protein
MPLPRYPEVDWGEGIEKILGMEQTMIASKWLIGLGQNHTLLATIA